MVSGFAIGWRSVAKKMDTDELSMPIRRAPSEGRGFAPTFFGGVFFAGAFFAGAFFTTNFPAGAPFAAAFFAGAFLAGAFFTGNFFAGAFFAGTFFIADFIAGAFFAGAFFAAAFFAGAFFAGAFFAGAFAWAFFGAAFFAGGCSVRGLCFDLTREETDIWSNNWRGVSARLLANGLSFRSAMARLKECCSLAGAREKSPERSIKPLLAC